MPLSEFLKMAGMKIQPGQRKPSPIDPSFSRVDNNLVELVWENGQIMMQGQSSRVTRSPIMNNLPSTSPRIRDARVGLGTNSRFGKFGVVESFLNDIYPIVPSAGLGVSQDDEMAPWLTYPVDDALPQDYCSEFLPEISGVTANGMSAQSNFLSGERRSSCDQIVSNFHGDGNVLKIASPKPRLSSPWLPPQCQISDPSLGSGVSSVSGNKHPIATYINSVPAGNMAMNPSSMKMERQNIRPPSNNSNLLNFSCFSKPAALDKPDIPSANGNPTLTSPSLKRMEVEDKGTATGCNNVIKSSLTDRLNNAEKGIDVVAPPPMLEAVTSRPPVNKPKDSFPAENTGNLFRQTSLKNEKPIVVGNTVTAAKEGQDGERAVEQMVACSSVGSGNSGDRASYENTHNSKRKFCDIEESECRSHGVESESAGIKKATPARGGTGSKRSRAAEVHNLSERRRRDRINEKMRALQELIPNCNKADKASMLDEAIEYLKTLQLQVQIMSMSAGLYMAPMMFPPGIQHMHPGHMPFFPPIGIGVGMGMGFGMGMVDMNGGSPILPVPPMQGPHFPSPMPGPINFPRIPNSNLQLYGHPGQAMPNSLPREPLVPSTAQSSFISAMDPSPLKTADHSEPQTMSVGLDSGIPITNKNTHILPNFEAGSSSINHTSNQVQAINETLDKPAAVRENKQAADMSSAAVISTTATDISKETG